MTLLTGNLVYDLIGLTVTLLVGLIAYMKWKFAYWDKVGLPTLTPSVPFGNMKDLILGYKSFGVKFQELYEVFKAKGYRHAGAYIGGTPLYIPIDPELVKHIMQIDFAQFNSHGGYVNEEHDPLSGHLFNLSDAKWRNLRAKLTPTFTSGKMKMMFHTLAKSSIELKDLLNESATNQQPVNSRDVLSRFGIDVISSVAFGLECNSMKDPNVEFRHYGRRAVEFEFRDTFKLFMQVLLPATFLNLIKHKFTKPDVEEFFLKAVSDMVNYREQNKIYRPDFMHLLLQLKNRGTVTDDADITDETGESKEVALTIKQLAAQAYVFFMAGYETSANTVTFALYELALNTDIQDKLRNEINAVLVKYDGEITHQAMMEMTYMEKVIQETLRKYPPLPILTRECSKDYVVPGTSVVIKKGTGVIIPVLGLQKDAEYYPNPDVFDPERFSEEMKKTRPAFTWIPFGDGPRICIGMRFGMLQSKVALATFIKNYKVKLNKATTAPLQFEERSFVTKAKGVVLFDLQILTD